MLKSNKFLKYKKIIGVAFFVVCGVLLYFVNSKGETVELSPDSKNVSVKYIENVEDIKETDFNLVELSEKDIFSNNNIFIIRGIIKEIKNIEIDFGGEIEYKSIIKIKVNKVLSGESINEDTITVLVPCAIDENILNEDSETVSQFKVGEEGIFMPVKYTDQDVEEINHGKLILSDIAEYGLFDGSRFAFLENENGLVYSSNTYKSLENSTNLEEVESYIKKIIQ